MELYSIIMCVSHCAGRIVLYRIAPYVCRCTALHCTVLFCPALYCTVLCTLHRNPLKTPYFFCLSVTAPWSRSVRLPPSLRDTQVHNHVYGQYVRIEIQHGQAPRTHKLLRERRGEYSDGADGEGIDDCGLHGV